MEKRAKIGTLDFLLSNNFKSVATMLLSVVAVIRCISLPSISREICMYAVLISTLADLILMNYRNVPKTLFKKANFGVGAFLFGIVQILYHACFLKIMGMTTLDTLNSGGYMALAIGVFVVPSLLFIMSEKSHVYAIGVLIYATCTLLNMITIFNCAYMFGGRHIFAVIGIILFMISDIFILIRENMKDSTFIRKLIWIFYPLGQILIIFGV